MLNRSLRVPYTPWDFVTATLAAGILACLIAWAASERDWSLVVTLVVGAAVAVAASFYEHRTLPAVPPDRESRVWVILIAVGVVVAGIAVVAFVSNPYLEGAAAFAILIAPAGVTSRFSGPRPDRDALSKPAERFFTWTPIVIVAAASVFFLDDVGKKRKHPRAQQQIEIVKPADEPSSRQSPTP